MATFVQTNCKLYADGYNWSGDMNAMALEYGVEAQDNTAHSSNTRKNLGGLKVVTCAHEGLYQGGAALDKVYFNKIATVDTPMTIAPTTGAIGQPAFFFKSMLSQYAPSMPVGEMMRFSVSGVGTGDLIRGSVLFPLSTKTASSTSTPQNLGAVLSTQHLYAALHVTAASASDTLDVIIESDSAEAFDQSAETQITFTQKAAIGSQYATPVAGAITDTWWRIGYTIAGTDESFTFAVVMGIQ